MKLREPVLRHKKKKVNLSTMLNSEYLYPRSIQIQMALNQDRIVPRDYFIQKAKAKIKTGQRKKISNSMSQDNKNDSSFEANREKDKKLIPYELDKIIEETKKKFARENKKYKELKQTNDVISGFWHFINQTNKRKERQLLFKKYFSKDDKSVVNLYSDQLQKSTFNLFKANPLLVKKKNSDLFFHYLSEFDKYYNDENKCTYVKQKVIGFLERLRDFLEFVKIKSDFGMDSISKDIKIKNSKFYKEFEMKIKNEIKNIKAKNKIINSQDIKESEKIINKTKKTLNALSEDKKIFEDPSYFDPMFSPKYNKRSRNGDFIYKYSYNYKSNTFSSSPDANKDNNTKNLITNNNINYTPNKTFKMSTMSTGFYVPEKTKDMSTTKTNEIIVNESNIKEKILDYNETKVRKNEKKKKRSISSIFNNISIKNKNINDILNEPKKYKISLNLRSNKEVEMFSERDSTSSFINIGNDTNKKKKIMNKNYNSKRRSEEEDTLKHLSNTSSTKQIYFFPKKFRRSSVNVIKSRDLSKEIDNAFRKKSFVIKAKDKIYSKIYKNNSDLNIKNTEKNVTNVTNVTNKINSFANYNNNQYQNLNNDYYQNPITLLYESIKDKQKIKEDEVNKINNYLKKSGKEYNNNVKSMDIIRQAKKISDRLDLEKNTKKVFQPYLSFEQVQKLDNIKKVNKNLYKLDVQYMSQLFDYKSKTSDSLQLYGQN